MLVTKSYLKNAFVEAGISAGDHIMLHASVKRIGWLVGGPEIVLRALFETITADGTLMMYCGWGDSPYTMEGWPEEKKSAYYRECPGFDPRTSRAVKEWSVQAEILRTWPGTLRSNHPDSSFCAWGFHARYFTEHHPLKYGLGAASPLGKLIQAKGKILLLGAPFDSVTLLHHSECCAKVANKRVLKYSLPVSTDVGSIDWVEIEEFDTNSGIGNNPDSSSYFRKIIEEYNIQHSITEIRIGMAPSYLLDAASLDRFATQWMENNL